MEWRRRSRRAACGGDAEEVCSRVSSQSSAHPPHQPGSANGEVDWYKVLGVPYAATAADIRQAYRAAIKEIHPDRQQAARRATAEESAKLLNQAYATLSNPVRRREYDDKIRANIVQDQLMRRYVGGFLTPDMVGDEHGARFHREPTAEEQRDQARAARSAMVSVVIVFTAIAVIVVLFLLLWAILGQVLSSLT